MNEQKTLKIKDIFEKYADRELFINSPDGPVRIGDFYKKKRQLCSVYTENRSDIFSIDHKLLSTKGWIDAKDSMGEEVLTYLGFEKVINVELGKESTVYDFEVLHEQHRYYTASGFCSHNTGKTFLALNVVREAQKMGYYVIYGDSETAVDVDTMTNFGIDPDRVRYQPLKTVLHTRHVVTNLCAMLREQKKKNDIPKIMFVIDSLGNLATEKESADALSGSDKRDMTKQQNLRSMFRVITTDLAEFKIPLIMTNHTYDAVGSYIPMQVVSGGGGAIYNASIILNLAKAGLKDGDSEAAEAGIAKTGIVVTSKPFKNRFAKPIPVKFHISFFKGMNPYVGLENYVSWETCGIARGKLIEEIIETPIFEEDGVTPKMYRGKPKIERTKTGNYTIEADPKANTFAVRHLGKTVKGSAVFNSEVFTEEILRKLDEEIIKPMFELPKYVSDEEDLSDELGLGNEEENDETES